MLSSELVSALRIIYEALPVDEVNWALSGRASLVLQDVDVEVSELDILTCEKRAYEVERRLRPFSVKHVEYVEHSDKCSYFGMLSINGINSEIIGAPQVRSHDGEWGPPTDVLENRRFVDYCGMRIPVTTLDYEATALRTTGDTLAAEMVASFLAHEASH